MADAVQLVVIDPRSPRRGMTLSRWDSYQFVNDLFTDSDHFKFVMRVGANADGVTIDHLRQAREAVGDEMVVQLQSATDQTVLATGIVDDVFCGGSRDEGLSLEISGRDCLGILQDNVASQSLRLSGVTFPELVDKTVAKYRGLGIPFNVETDNESNRDVMTGRRKPLQKRVGSVSLREVKTARGSVRAPTKKSHPDRVPGDFVRLPIQEARPHGGETEFAFLNRHARNLGVMMWTSTGGNIVLSRPNYDQDVLFTFQRTLLGGAGNNIISGGKRRNRGNSATKVKMLGHTSGRGSFKEQIQVEVEVARRVAPPTESELAQILAQARLDTQRSIQRFQVDAVAEDWVWPRVRVVHDGNAKDSERARREARRELSRHNVNIEALEIEVPGYSQDGIYYCPDTLAFVNDEWAGAYGTYYIVSRTYSKNRGGGSRVSLRLIPKYAYILD